MSYIMHYRDRLNSECSLSPLLLLTRKQTRVPYLLKCQTVALKAKTSSVMRLVKPKAILALFNDDQAKLTVPFSLTCEVQALPHKQLTQMTFLINK